MEHLYSLWSNFWMNLSSVFNIFSFRDLLDIAIMAYIIYNGVRLVRETRAMQLVKGIAAILVIYFAATQARMIGLSFFMQNILQVGIFALVVVFQPELRRALEQLGRTKFSSSMIGRFGSSQVGGEQSRSATEKMIEAVCASCAQLSEERTGALIVIEQEIRLGEVIKTGTTIDAMAVPELITNIFFPNSPLHDGAMIIRGNRICAAGCFLPLSENMEIGRELGTRHRAALGESEVSDAIVVVVSEETGAISVANDSKLRRKLSVQNLQKMLASKLLGSKNVEDGAARNTSFWRKKK